jgi:hypothetical protein
MTDEQRAAERRRETRYKVNCMVIYHFGSKGDVQNGLVYDISKSGIRIATSEPVGLSEELWVLIDVRDGLKIGAKAEAMWVSETGDDAGQAGGKFFAGLRFTEILAEDRQGLDSYIKELIEDGD